MTLTAAPTTATSFDLGPARALLSRVRATRSRSPRSSPVRSASGRSRSPTTSARSPAPSIEAGPEVDLALPAAAARAHRRHAPPQHRARADPPDQGATGWPRRWACASLWVKDDTGNPTHSFKDRVVAVALAAARELGFTVLACPSTGNLANAVAAAAARAGWDSVVLIPSSLERAKVLTTAVYGGTLLAVDGNYDDVNRLATELAAEHEDWAFVNVNVRPYYAEGSKTLGYEVAEQLGWRLPGQVVVPVASGSQLTKVDKGFRELGKLGLVEPTPYRVFGAQATGLLAGRPRRSPTAATWCSPCGRTPSPARWPSATRPTGPTCSTPCAAPAARSRTSPTRRSSRASGCWPGPRACSPRRRAA